MTWSAGVWSFAKAISTSLIVVQITTLAVLWQAKVSSSMDL